MKSIAILGATGSIGSGVYRQLKDKYSLLLVVRDAKKIALLDAHYGGITKHSVIPFETEQIYKEYLRGFNGKDTSPAMRELMRALGTADAVINCAGIINRYTKERSGEAMFVNGGLPHILSAQLGEKLIHITTNCVYGGVSGAPYDEDATPNPYDIYGISKLIGECSRNSFVLRTSTIGPEIDNFVGLLEWVKKQEGQVIKGYTRHLWNGITTLEFGKICEKIIENRAVFPKTGLYHIFSNDMTKFDMVTKIAKKYGVNCIITPDDAQSIDRRLATKYDVCKKLKIPSFDEMLADL